MNSTQVAYAQESFLDHTKESGQAKVTTQAANSAKTSPTRDGTQMSPDLLALEGFG
jgi:hypothetical protein